MNFVSQQKTQLTFFEHFGLLTLIQRLHRCVKDVHKEVHKEGYNCLEYCC
ncbi:hypothetical protein OQJ05_14580 [Fluoribacter gormanii]|nr:hypothetical protein [Fluoribacter gormanii]MCW8445274.1 hypothetical protein [Fluoribacter gormanii]